MIKKAPSKSARVGGIPIPLIANLIMMIPMTIKSPFEIRSTGPWAFLECMNSVLAMTKNKIYLFLKLSAKRFLHHAHALFINASYTGHPCQSTHVQQGRFLPGIHHPGKKLESSALVCHGLR